MARSLLMCSTLCFPNRSLRQSSSSQNNFSLKKADYPGHVPVLLEQVLNILNPMSGDRVMDCTAGLGGHAAAIAQRLGPSGTISLLDADAANLLLAANRVRSSNATGGPSIFTHHMNFRNLASLAQKDSFDIIIADLGLCSSQIDDIRRGFSFRTQLKGDNVHPLTDVDAPLDMRFDQSATSSSVPVSDWLRRTKAFDVANVLIKLGEVRPSAARRIATSIAANLPVTSTKQLRDIVVRQTGEVQPPLAQVRSIPRVSCPQYSFLCHSPAGVSGLAHGGE
jgi:16S rRNA (cytosine1402-N4)-methyltransferase